MMNWIADAVQCCEVRDSGAAAAVVFVAVIVVVAAATGCAPALEPVQHKECMQKRNDSRDP
jgi:hypothetical protein